MNSNEEIIDIREPLLAAIRSLSGTVGATPTPGTTALADTAFVSAYALSVFPVHGQWFGEAKSQSLHLRARFDVALRSWKQDTRYESSLRRIVLHQSYQSIIGMGEAALPFIFEEFQNNGGHWLWALHAITQEDPAHEGDSFRAAAHAWLRWGQARGYVHPPSQSRSRSYVS